MTLRQTWFPIALMVGLFSVGTAGSAAVVQVSTLGGLVVTADEANEITQPIVNNDVLDPSVPMVGYTGASLDVSAASYLYFEFVGYEAGDTNKFQSRGDNGVWRDMFVNKTSSTGAWDWVNLTTNTNFGWRFFNDYLASKGRDPYSYDADPDIYMGVKDRWVYLALDDRGKYGKDDDYDDHVVRVTTFTKFNEDGTPHLSSVPLPTALLLFGSALSLFGIVTMRGTKR